MKMTQCPGCGAQMPVLMSYCTKCGEPIAAQTMSSSSPLPNDVNRQSLNESPSTSLFKGIYPPYVIIGVFVFLLVVAMINDESGLLTRGVGSILLFIGAVLLYFLPSLIADRRKHHNKWPIFLVNLLLGWSALGWVAALVWSVMAVKPNNNGVLTSG